MVELRMPRRSVAARAVVVARVAAWRRAALHRGQVTPVVALAPAGMRGWLSHWADAAVAPRRSLCTRCGAQAWISRLLICFRCQLVAALPVSAPLLRSVGGASMPRAPSAEP